MGRKKSGKKKGAAAAGPSANGVGAQSTTKKNPSPKPPKENKPPSPPPAPLEVRKPGAAADTVQTSKGLAEPESAEVVKVATSDEPEAERPPQ